ncbi:putative dynein heavy chain [Trypanosoma conorhini]|uniref:Putative dynein heavy chain n=1 Tax=Trypanosoma conorhini TaxID=83891 RepID=A0A422Q9M6_9TRYP|nr:putative dynein heavy chain [Trypanosoma conorhini]RNF26666.1 putative dynein heavy chain [Trypanosoma conorhini]
MFHFTAGSLKNLNSWYAKGTMRGGVPRIYYAWMRPGSFTRRRFEKMRNPFVDLETGTSLYFRDTRDSAEAVAHAADSKGLKGMDNAIDLYNEYRIVPDLYPEGFQWKHKLNTEYNQWRSNTWLTPDLIPQEHRGRFLCNFQLNIVAYDMRVVKFSPKDHRQWIYCVLYVGSGKGIAGWGRAVAPSTQEAKKEAIREAFSNIIAVDLEQEGPMYPVRVNADGVRVLLYPAKRIVANFRVADILCAFGFQHAGCRINLKATNNPKSPTHTVEGVFEAVKALRSVSEIAASRGKVPHSLIYNIYPYLEEMRRRKGMMAMHPPGKDGLLMPDRVVDNRLPDHLKKGYYDDVYWRDFFAGSREHLNEPKMGLRGDEMRQRLEAAQSRSVPSAPGTGRRTLEDVLKRLGKTTKDLGSLPIVNPRLDIKLPTHIKRNYSLH